MNFWKRLLGQRGQRSNRSKSERHDLSQPSSAVDEAIRKLSKKVSDPLLVFDLAGDADEVAKHLPAESLP